MKIKYKLKLDKLVQGHFTDLSFFALFSSKKGYFHTNKKAYLQIDLMVSMLIFFFIIFLVFNFFDVFNKDSQDQLIISNLASDSRDLCYLLTSSSGFPNNWEDNISNLEFVGLKKVGSHELDSNKLDAFNSSNYLVFLDSLNLSGFFKIEIDGLNSSTNYLSLGSSAGVSSYASYSTCYSIYNYEIVQVITEVWK